MEQTSSNKNIYIGNRYTPKHDSVWDINKDYESLTVVLWEGNSYTTRKNTPAGVDIHNEDYWSLSANFNAQIENYRNDVINLETSLTDVNNEVTNARNGESTLSNRLDKDKQEVINLETSLTDVNNEITNARNGESTLSNRLDKDKQEVNTQLKQTVSGELGKKPIVLAGVIRNTGEGWFYIEDEGHNRINMSTVSVQDGSIRVEHTPLAKKVGALVATPDETFGKEGMIVGASVGNTFSLIDLFMPLNVQIKGDGTFVARSYFTPSLELVFSSDNSSFTLTHNECDPLDIPIVISPISVGSSGEYAVSYSGTSVTVERREDLAGYIYYDVNSSSWKYVGDNVNNLEMIFGGGMLTVTHDPINGNAYSLVLTEREGGYKPVVVSPSKSQFQVKLQDSEGNFITTPDANCKFYFARPGAKYKTPFKTTERVVLKRGVTKVDAEHVVNTAGNIWLQGLMQN